MKGFFMKRMKWNGLNLEVTELILLRNGWEYYVIGERTQDIFNALVWGFEIELGDVSYEEIKPYIMCSEMLDKDSDALPIPDGEWMDNNE
jgi:hypothetical protein